MPRSSVSLTLLDARRFHRRAVGLDKPAASLAEALERLGFVQIDPLNVCGRMHDLILRNRVAGYTEGGLMRFLHGGDGRDEGPTLSGQRGGFEHFLPGSGILVGLPFDAWPRLHPVFEERKRRNSGYFSRLTPPEERLAQRILAEIRDRGPLSSDAIDHDEKAVTAWGSKGRSAKVVLEKLFAHGLVLISERRRFRRIYDLPERIIPGKIFQAPAASAEDVRQWSVCMRLKQRRLVSLRPEERRQVADLIAEVRVEDGPSLCVLAEDLPLLERPNDSEDQTPRLLAPLDPLIYDRRLTSRLWGFDYTWEVYTPAAKRVRGYYALPVLRGTELAGHVEPRFDRGRGRITVLSRRLRRGVAAAGAVRELERFLKAAASR